MIADKFTRRHFILAAVSSGSAVAQCRPGESADRKLPDWCESKFNGHTVFRRGSGPPVLLMHEITGLSRACIALGKRFADEGKFTVYMPKLFGHAPQDNFILGYIESCWFGGFHCGSMNEGSPVVWLRNLCDHISAEGSQGKQSIGVIGMCETGGYPVALMTQDCVAAAVMSQPALPFGGSMDKKQSIGVSSEHMALALKRKIPILAFRFEDDTICPRERFPFLRSYFGAEQFKYHEFKRGDVHGPITHHLHAVLTGGFPNVSETAFAEAKAFLEHALQK